MNLHIYFSNKITNNVFILSYKVNECLLISSGTIKHKKRLFRAFGFTLEISTLNLGQKRQSHTMIVNSHRNT